MNAHRLVFSALAAVLGALVFASAPALAAPLEAPELTVESVVATTATLHGVLNPLKASGAGTYEFLYKQGKAGCTGGMKAPVPAGLMTGTEHEEVYEGISGLPQDTEYTACLRAVNTTSVPSEEAMSPAVTFTTAIAPETPTVRAAQSVTATSATFEGVLNPHAAGNPGSYEFRYRASATECEGAGGEASGGVALGHEKEAVKAEVTLLPNTTYTFCLRAYNGAGETSLSSLVTFSTPVAAPVVESESSANVNATEARLEAQINPGNSETAYHFEYGLGAGSYGVSTPVREIPAGLTGVGVNVVLNGLTPGTTYHYRVVASNALPGTVGGSDETFATPLAQASGSPSACPNEQLRAEQPYALVLPDCRAYEMVSPVNTEGQDATDSFLPTISRAAVSGEAVTYGSPGNFAAPTGGAIENQFVSRRGQEGWSTQAITPLRHSQKTEVVPQYPSRAFTPELTEGIVNSNYALTGEAPEGESILGLYVANFVNGSYRYVGLGNKPVGASTDLSHVVVSAQSFGGRVLSGLVYEWVDGHVSPVSVTNSGQGMEALVGSILASRTWRAVSADGSRVYFTAVGSPAHEGFFINSFAGLYVRVNAEQPQSPVHVVNGKEECEVPADACTIEVSASQRRIADPDGPQTAYYWGASTDGSRVFFTSSAELTEDANTGPADNAENLYEYDLERPAGERLKDLTVDDTDTDGAAVQGVVQISEDGSYVYFVANGDLDGKAVTGEPNLYVSHDDGAPRFIAPLAAKDGTDWEKATDFEKEKNGQVGGGLESGTATVSPSGSDLAFISERGLTGYNNEQVEPGECEQTIGGSEPFGKETGKCREIYLYDAETGGLACASCNPSGARPVGPANFYPKDGYLFGAKYFEYRPRNLLEDGALFFDSGDALVPHASDGRVNVYEYEDGHVYPISDVAGGFESFFMDASPDGDNVFFGTADQLLPQDTSNNVVVYDARVDGGYPVSVAPPPCDNGDSCKPPPAPQPGLFGAPGSATFSGPGNIPPAVKVTPAVKAKAKSVKCKKGYEKKKDKCVRKPKKKKRAKKSSDRKGSK